MAVAILNIEIPQIMGGVVNVVARFSDTHDSALFLKEMKGPALKLVTMYIAQVTSQKHLIFNSKETYIVFSQRLHFSI